MPEPIFPALPIATLKIHFRRLVILLLYEVVHPKPVHKLLWRTNILITLGTYSPVISCMGAHTACVLFLRMPLTPLRFRQ